MRKSLEILQASTLELSQLVRVALETNPVLEDITESTSLDELGPDPEEADSLDYLNETDDDWRDRSILEGRSSPWTSEDEERRQRLYDSIVAPETLQQHLSYQLDLSMVEPGVREAGKAIIANLDERGFLDLPAKELGVRMNLKPADLKAALTLIQSFDPPGVGAENIPQSLLIQLEREQFIEPTPPNIAIGLAKTVAVPFTCALPTCILVPVATMLAEPFIDAAPTRIKYP